jgi:hypothetical protein
MVCHIEIEHLIPVKFVMRIGKKMKGQFHEDKYGRDSPKSSGAVYGVFWRCR